jgi:hypothetical protein
MSVYEAIGVGLFAGPEGDELFLHPVVNAITKSSTNTAVKIIIFFINTPLQFSMLFNTCALRFVLSVPLYILRQNGKKIKPGLVPVSILNEA